MKASGRTRNRSRSRRAHRAGRPRRSPRRSGDAPWPAPSLRAATRSLPPPDPRRAAGAVSARRGAAASDRTRDRPRQTRHARLAAAARTDPTGRTAPLARPRRRCHPWRDASPPRDAIITRNRRACAGAAMSLLPVPVSDGCEVVPCSDTAAWVRCIAAARLRSLASSRHGAGALRTRPGVPRTRLRDVGGDTVAFFADGRQQTAAVVRPVAGAPPRCRSRKITT